MQKTVICIQPGAAANNSSQYHKNTVTADNSTEAVRSKSLLAAWDASQPKLILAFTHQLFWIDGVEPTPVPYSNSMEMSKQIKDHLQKNHFFKTHNNQSYEDTRNLSSNQFVRHKIQHCTPGLAQLRSSHRLKVAHCRHRIDKSKSDIFSRCQDEPEIVKHWLHCPGAPPGPYAN